MFHDIFKLAVLIPTNTVYAFYIHSIVKRIFVLFKSIFLLIEDYFSLSIFETAGE